MYKGVIRWIGLLLLVLLTSSCTIVNTSGKKDSNFHGEIQSMLIVFHDVWQTSPNSGGRFSPTSINQFVRYIAQSFSNRTPAVFNQSGISTRVVRTSVSASLQYQTEPHTYVMLIQPYSVSGRYTLEAVVLKANITYAGNPAPVWTGQFSFVPSASALSQPKAMDESVDELARKILMQLKKDGLVNIQQTDTVTPSR